MNSVQIFSLRGLTCIGLAYWVACAAEQDMPASSVPDVPASSTPSAAPSPPFVPDAADQDVPAKEVPYIDSPVGQLGPPFVVRRRASGEPPPSSSWVPLPGTVVLDEGPPEPPQRVPKRKCTRDDQCGDGFCDRDRCSPHATREQRYSFGLECDPLIPSRCGGFLCIDGKCRSCVSDAECMKEQDSPTCGVFGQLPGKSCGIRVEGVP
jgi:hypothetical protein